MWRTTTFASDRGLRKAGGARASEQGATTEQLKALFGWKTSAQADTYTRKADRARLARDSIGVLAREDDDER